MTVISKTSVVTASILGCLIVVGLFPSASTFMLVTVISTALILYLTYTVLTDDYVVTGSAIGPEPGYLEE